MARPQQLITPAHLYQYPEAEKPSRSALAFERVALDSLTPHRTSTLKNTLKNTVGNSHRTITSSRVTTQDNPSCLEHMSHKHALLLKNDATITYLLMDVPRHLLRETHTFAVLLCPATERSINIYLLLPYARLHRNLKVGPMFEEQTSISTFRPPQEHHHWTPFLKSALNMIVYSNEYGKLKYSRKVVPVNLTSPTMQFRK